MTQTTDEAALLKAIVAHPDEDTPRLVYADWLDEAGDHARAEFIRLSVAGEFDQAAANTAALFLEAHRERFLRVPCERCGGTGEYWVPTNRSPLFEQMKVRCAACDGTGDATRLTDNRGAGGTNCGIYRFPVTFACGFPYSLGGCRLKDLFVQQERQKTCPDCIHWKGRVPPDCRCLGSRRVAVNEWRPTPWALAVFRAHPTLARVPPTCRTPLWDHAAGYGWRRADGWPTTHDALANLPPPVFDALEGGMLVGNHRYYEISKAATGALATACGDVLRQAARETSAGVSC